MIFMLGDPWKKWEEKLTFIPIYLFLHRTQCVILPFKSIIKRLMLSEWSWSSFQTRKPNCWMEYFRGTYLCFFNYRKLPSLPSWASNDIICQWQQSCHMSKKAINTINSKLISKRFIILVILENAYHYKIVSRFLSKYIKEWGHLFFQLASFFSSLRIALTVLQPNQS